METDNKQTIDALIRYVESRRSHFVAEQNVKRTEDIVMLGGILKLLKAIRETMP